MDTNDNNNNIKENNNNKIIINDNDEEKNNQEDKNKEKDDNSDNNNNDSHIPYNYKALCDDKILGRFSLHEKICIINKLNIIVYGKIKKELLMELRAKKIENKILLIKSRYKTALILHKKLYSLIQEKMLRDFNFKKKLKDLRKKLMDEKIDNLKYKNIVCIMKSYGIFREDKSYR